MQIDEIRTLYSVADSRDARFKETRNGDGLEQE